MLRLNLKLRSWYEIFAYLGKKTAKTGNGFIEMITFDHILDVKINEIIKTDGNIKIGFRLY